MNAFLQTRIAIIVFIIISMPACSWVRSARIERAPHVPIPDSAKRSDPVDITNGLDDIEETTIATWIAKYDSNDDELAAEVKSELKPIFESLHSPNIKFSDLKSGGRFQSLFPGNPAGMPYFGQDARFQYKIRDNEILVMIPPRKKHFAYEFAFVFYRFKLPKNNDNTDIFKMRHAEDSGDHSQVENDTIFKSMLIIPRTLIETRE